MAFMTTATSVPALVGAGNNPSDPPMSMWEYLKGWAQLSMCLSRPDTLWYNMLHYCTLRLPDDSSSDGTHSGEKRSREMVAPWSPAGGGVVALENIHKLARLVVDEIKVILPDHRDLNELVIGRGLFT